MTSLAPATIAKSAFYLSTAMSITFNVHGTLLDTNSPVAVGISVGWSGISLLGVEIMTKVKFPTLTPAQRKAGKRNAWGLVRYGVVGFVSLLAMVLTYGHAYSSMAHWQADTLSCVVAPIAVDGMMLLAGLALLVSPSVKRKPVKAKQPVRLRKVA